MCESVLWSMSTGSWLWVFTFGWGIYIAYCLFTWLYCFNVSSMNGWYVDVFAVCYYDDTTWLMHFVFWIWWIVISLYATYLLFPFLSCIFSIQYDCPNTDMCSINCATDGLIDRTTSSFLPINNYGNFYLRVKICAKGTEIVINTTSFLFCRLLWLTHDHQIRRFICIFIHINLLTFFILIVLVLLFFFDDDMFYQSCMLNRWIVIPECNLGYVVWGGILLLSIPCVPVLFLPIRLSRSHYPSIQLPLKSIGEWYCNWILKSAVMISHAVTILSNCRSSFSSFPSSLVNNAYCLYCVVPSLLSCTRTITTNVNGTTYAYNCGSVANPICQPPECNFPGPVRENLRTELDNNT